MKTTNTENSFKSQYKRFPFALVTGKKRIYSDSENRHEVLIVKFLGIPIFRLVNTF